MADAKELDWPELLNFLASLSQSTKAKDLCKDLSPCKNQVEARLMMQNTMDAVDVIAEAAIPELTVIDSLPRIFERLRIHAILDVREFIILRTFFTSTGQLKNILKGVHNPWAEIQNQKTADFKTSLYMINKVISPDGEINEDASPTLAALNEEKRKLTREVAFILDRVLAKRQLESSLQDRYVTTREGRLVLPVKSGNQHDIKGLIHDRSFSKQTVFVEPEEAVPVNNRLRDLQLLIVEEIEKILKELSTSMTRQMTSLENAAAVLLDCDVNFAQAKLTKAIKAIPVEFSENHTFKLNGFRHPLLVIKGVDVVANSVELNADKRVLLLSGPNAGGKTILLKTLGLCAQMARCGLPLPVEAASTVPFFKRIDSVVGDLQSVDQNLSSFSSHMQRLTETLKFEGPDFLILVDEICGATDPEEGSALARSFIEHYIEKNIFVVITSHLGPLKENWSKEDALVHGSLEFDVKSNKPTYQLLMGIPGQSLALAVAKRLGVPDFILKRAESFLSPLSRAKAENLNEIEALREQIVDLKKQTLSDREAALKDKNQYAELIKKFREQKDRWLEKAIQKAEKKIENLIEDARQERLKNKTIQDIKADLPTIIRASPAAVSRPQTAEDFKINFRPGTPAFSSRLGRNVVVQSEPDNKGQVSVLADSMRVVVPWHTLTAVGGASEATPVRSRPSPHSSSSSPSDDNLPQLDLRGKRVDEALILVEKWLDNCVRDGVDQVKIVHGFGTEQLKKSLRQYLSKSEYVSKWNAGDSSTGGDGTTLVYLG